MTQAHFDAVMTSRMEALRPKPKPAPAPVADPDELLSLEYVAKLCKVAVKTVHRWKALPKFKQGGVVRIRRGDFQTFVAGNTAADKLND